MQQWNAELPLKEGAGLRDIQGPPRLLDLPSNASLFHSKRRYLGLLKHTIDYLRLLLTASADFEHT